MFNCKKLMVLSALLSTTLLGFASHSIAAEKEKTLRFTYLTQTGIDNTFWQTIKRGMDDACETLKADCQLLFTQENGNLQMHLQNFETVVNQGVDGIVTVVVDDNLYDEAIQRAVDKGIPVIVSNVDDTQGELGSARLAFVGQDLFQAGYEVAKGLAEQFDRSKPAHVLLGLARPGESWAEDRIGGAKKYLKELNDQNPEWKVTFDVIDSGNDLSITGSRICQYVQGHPETSAVIGAGFWFAGAGECLRDLGKKPDEILMGGFDLVPILIDEMKKGYVHLTVDQQPYLQGYLPILQLHLINKFGLSAWDVNTGKALITKKDVPTLEKYIDQGVR
ncbi:sugar ABC transporter substrate-binding protein [Vibrio nigripulchritudo]|uniref:sugar ABC transporter substrate-binding protein n=1 Tax=Vibrio nigripulchritudo TaxID=28173 RepID=UPI0003B19BC5|nr:sugar ABC transporter substrate-binding protein [Vibrio nigripulchritudo]CCN71763.1 putative ABC-type sugar transport system,periplasmic component [Vibrio nigripulchritudo SFn118]